MVRYALSAQAAAADGATSGPAQAGPKGGLELDTAVYQFDDSDLTPEMIREGAVAELESLEKYKVYKGGFCTYEETRAGAYAKSSGSAALSPTVKIR